MIKLTTNQLYELANAIHGDVIRADIFSHDTKGIPNHPCAWARDIRGVKRILVVWTEHKIKQETPKLISVLLNP